MRVGSLNVGKRKGLGGYDGSEKGWSVSMRLDGRGTKLNSW